MKFPFVRRSTHEQLIGGLNQIIHASMESERRLLNRVDELAKEKCQLEKRAKYDEQRFIDVLSQRMPLDGFGFRPVQIRFDRRTDYPTMSEHFCIGIDAIGMVMAVDHREMTRYAEVIPYLKESFARGIARKVSEEIEKQVTKYLDKEMK